MSERLFTPEEIKILRENPYVKNVSEKAITYTYEFKEYYIWEYAQGKAPSQILRSAGFDTRMLGKGRVKSISERYKKMAKRMEGMRDLRKENSGRPVTKELTVEEENKRLKHRIKYLEQENEFLKKIEFADKKACREQKRKKSSKSSRK